VNIDHAPEVGRRPLEARGTSLWRGDVRASTFEASVLGELFQCDLTFGLRPGGVRWTLVAIGNKGLSRGVVCTGTTPVFDKPRADIQGEIENDARSTLLTAVVLHAKDWSDR
jgi:hypothetical protein